MASESRPFALARRRGCRNCGFTMVEIALCLAIIAFALVAIIGVLPTGLRVQKENREDTIINQDGTYLVEAIRSGSRNLDVLTNFFDSITVSNVNTVLIFTGPRGLATPPPPGATVERILTNGAEIVGKLTSPKYVNVGGNWITNHVSGNIRALSGSAVDRGGQAISNEFAFAYHFKSEVVPMMFVPPSSTNLSLGGRPEDRAVRSNQWRMVQNQLANFHELRLTLQGPVLRRGAGYEVTGSPKTFRAILSGALTNPAGNLNVFVQPNTFVQVPP